MAIDTVVTRRAALGRSVVMLPPADSTIDKDDRAMLLRLFLSYTVVAVVTPAARIYAIAQSLRIYAVRHP